jgi:hypothetical protein
VRVHLLDVVWLPGCHCLKVYILDIESDDTVLSYETQSKEVPPWSRLVSAPTRLGYGAVIERVTGHSGRSREPAPLQY